MPKFSWVEKRQSFQKMVTPNMVAWNLDILEHDHSEVTWNLVTPTWLYSTLVIATL